jgi:hypothetical protein
LVRLYDDPMIMYLVLVGWFCSLLTANEWFVLGQNLTYNQSAHYNNYSEIKCLGISSAYKQCLASLNLSGMSLNMT